VRCKWRKNQGSADAREKANSIHKSSIQREGFTFINLWERVVGLGFGSEKMVTQCIRESTYSENWSSQFEVPLRIEGRNSFLIKWISKVLGYDFLSNNKKGADNRFVDALSRRCIEIDDYSLSLVTFPKPK
jgi:hypothetical protein